MNTIELITKAIDSNGFQTTATEAGYINPEYWNQRVLDHVKANLVVSQFAVDFSSQLKDGDTLNITIRDEPTAAAAVAESASATITAWTVSTKQFSPTEYTKAYSLSDKERKRAFFSVMEAMSSDIGYALALERDTLAVTQLQASAGNSVVANGVASSAIASSDTIDHLDVLDAMKANEVDKMTRHTALFVCPAQKISLMKDPQFLNAYQFGTGSVPQNGLLGTVFGIPVYSTTVIPVGSSKAKAILISHPEAFGVVEKPFEGIKTRYDALGRFTEIVGTMDIDYKVLRANAVCTIESYAA